MIRKTSLMLLLTCSAFSVAQPLYKWVEADGSITFSPEKPAGDIKFETIERPAKSSATLEAAESVTPLSAAASPLSHLTARSPGGDASDTAREPLAGVSMAPIPDQQITASSIHQNSDTKALVETSDVDRIASIAASNKQSRCQDLRKRVVSLERRLKSRLTPEDMDNTVIHMARYQRSFDQHCER